MRIPALLLAAGAALAAPAFAETVTYYLWDPVSRSYVARTMETNPDPGPRVVYADPPATTYYVEPIASPVYVAPDIVVTAPRSEDALITNEIVDRIATHPRISGYVGVETPGQSRLAEREAKSVDGVDDVQNLIRTRVGGSY